MREMARLHGFPDWFRFHVTKWHGARQIGNAVPPPLAYAVGCSIRGLLPPAEIPEGILYLGDEGLLRMDMTEACKYWGVPNPIGNRDRKSAQRKRKQVDIERERLAQT